MLKDDGTLETVQITHTQTHTHTHTHARTHTHTDTDSCCFSALDIPLKLRILSHFSVLFPFIIKNNGDHSWLLSSFFSIIFFCYRNENKMLSLVATLKCWLLYTSLLILFHLFETVFFCFVCVVRRYLYFGGKNCATFLHSLCSICLFQFLLAVIYKCLEPWHLLYGCCLFAGLFHFVWPDHPISFSHSLGISI